MMMHIVPDGVQATPLARYLSRAWPALPAHVIREALRNRDVRVNGARSGADALVRAGDQLRIYIDDRFFERPLSVLFQDEQLLVVEKPVGLPVDADADAVGADTLISRARARSPSAQLCHRLDAGTGGTLILSLSDAAHEALVCAFREHRIQKRYQAVVCGRPPRGEGALHGFLLKDARSAKVCVMDHPAPGALPIETRYRVLKPALAESDALSLLEVELITGRTHQIRAHMAHIGCPLLGDDKYGERAMNKRFHVKSPLLWCERLRIDAGEPLSRYRGMEFISRPKFPIE